MRHVAVKNTNAEDTVNDVVPQRGERTEGEGDSGILRVRGHPSGGSQQPWGKSRSSADHDCGLPFRRKRLHLVGDPVSRPLSHQHGEQAQPRQRPRKASTLHEHLLLDRVAHRFLQLRRRHTGPQA